MTQFRECEHCGIEFSRESGGTRCQCCIGNGIAAAYSALRVYMREAWNPAYEVTTRTVQDELHSLIGDLLGDLMHLCREANVDFLGRYDMGRFHFEDESGETL